MLWLGAWRVPGICHTPHSHHSCNKERLSSVPLMYTRNNEVNGLCHNGETIPDPGCVAYARCLLTSPHRYVVESDSRSSHIANGAIISRSVCSRFAPGGAYIRR